MIELDRNEKQWLTLTQWNKLYETSQEATAEMLNYYCHLPSDPTWGQITLVELSLAFIGNDC